MTLVIGCVAEDMAFLVADTLVSFGIEPRELNGRISGEAHVLKIHVLDSKTAVAFAGDVDVALKLIHRLPRELRSEMDPCEWLQNTYLKLSDKGLGCEFLVLRLTETGPRLAHVTDGKIECCQRCYIGSSSDYQRMMALRMPWQPPASASVQQADGSFRTVPFVPGPGETYFTEICAALESLTFERRSDTVGAICGCVTRVVQARISRGLEYLQSGEVSRSAAEGPAGFSYLASNSGIRGVGIYYRAGKLGILFVVGDSERCRLVRAETIADFVELARREHGLNFEGVTWGPEWLSG